MAEEEKKANNNIVWHHAVITRHMRERLNEHKSVILWFTGLSGAGKSTLAHAVEEALYGMKVRTFVFDGDNVRHGLNKDLGFSRVDRKENLRRIAEMCRLFIEAGVMAMTAFISPYKQDREMVKEIVGDDEFIEIFCKCSLDTCEKRDVKGLYARAKSGEIKEFTGVSAPYEVPEDPAITINTESKPLEECVEEVVVFLKKKGII